jgi:hypothetical protein
LSWCRNGYIIPKNGRLVLNISNEGSKSKQVASSKSKQVASSKSKQVASSKSKQVASPAHISYDFEISTILNCFIKQDNRKSEYRVDKLIINELMKVVKSMDTPNIVGYYWEKEMGDAFHSEVTILGGKMSEVLSNLEKTTPQHKMIILDGGMVHSIKNPFIKESPFTNTMKLNTMKLNTMKLNTMKLNTMKLNTMKLNTMKPTTDTTQVHKSTINHNIINEDVSAIIKEFYLYDYDNILSDPNTSNIHENGINQLELKQQALALITDIEFAEFVGKFLDDYIPYSVKNQPETFGGNNNRSIKSNKSNKRNKKTKKRRRF